jgi:hypothetical protein
MSASVSGANRKSISKVSPKSQKPPQYTTTEKVYSPYPTLYLSPPGSFFYVSTSRDPVTVLSKILRKKTIKVERRL